MAEEGEKKGEEGMGGFVGLWVGMERGGGKRWLSAEVSRIGFFPAGLMIPAVSCMMVKV